MGESVIMNFTDEEQKVFDYLDDLRDSGVTNMFGAKPYVQKEFGFDGTKATNFVTKWMDTFSERHPDD